MMMIIIMIMLMGLDYVSEIRRTTALFFIPRVMYEHGEPRWIDTNSGKIQIHSPDISDYSTSRII
jgi:hypothetical protein